MFNRKKTKAEIINQQKNPKTEAFDFERISLYFSNKQHPGTNQILSDKTLSDLDFEELFTCLDRTVSPIGQQYLYDTLRVISPDQTNFPVFKWFHELFCDDPDRKEKTVLELNKLNTPGAYFIQRLFFSEQMDRPKWYWLLPVLSTALVGSLIATFFYPQMFLAFITFCVINMIIHLWNKSNIFNYSNTLPLLLKLHSVTSRLNNEGIFDFIETPIDSAIQSINKVRRSTVFFKWESNILGELSQAFEFLIDLVKGVLLIEPILFFPLLDDINRSKSSIRILYESIGLLEVALSISTWKESLPYFCTPEFSYGSQKVWETKRIYHPLISEAQSNNLFIRDNNSILLSGSNMSGKTTFVRTIGINALLAQTLNVACCSSLTLSPFRIYSAVRISDDLAEGRSYYFEEVRTIKELITVSQGDSFNLFLLDEIFKGTNTIERVASGKAVLEYLNNDRNLVICATHDIELKDYLKNEFAFHHFSEMIENGSLYFDYQLKPGRLETTNAIRILEMNDFPSAITNEAKKIVEDMIDAKR